MDASTSQPAKHDTPPNTSEERPKDTPKPENGTTTSPAEAENNGDARQTLGYVENAADALYTTPEIKEKPLSPPDVKQLDVKSDPESRQKVSDGNANLMVTEDSGGPQQLSETPVDGTAQTIQRLKVEETTCVERASAGDNPTSLQQPKSLEMGLQSDESKLGAGSSDLSLGSTGSSHLRDGPLVMDSAKPKKSQSEEAGKAPRSEDVHKTENTECNGKLQESLVKDDKERELPPGHSEQTNSSAQKSGKQRSEKLRQKALSSPQDESKCIASTSEEQTAENGKETSKIHDDLTSEDLAQDKLSQDNPPQREPSQQTSSQKKPTKKDPSPQEIRSQSSPSGEHRARILPPAEGERIPETSVHKRQSQIKDENNGPSQSMSPSESPKKEASVQEVSPHRKSTEAGSSQHAKAAQQTETKASELDQPLQPRSIQETTGTTKFEHTSSRNEKQEPKQGSSQGSAQAQHKSASARQTSISQSMQQTQQQQAIRMKPAVQKQAPAAAQRLTRIPPAATEQRGHQPTKATLPGKTAGLVSKAAEKPIGVATQTTLASSQQTPNAQQSSRALQVARLVMNFLGPDHPPPQNPQLPTLNSLRTRLFADPNQYDARADQLAWQTREAIRTEFFKVLYPAPPPNSLLSLVTATESIFAPFQPRPFFFPGARVAVPTEAGSRRAATSLQLRFKKVDRTTVAEALLHLDGPNGGGFQWVQAPALTPLSLYAPQAPRTVQKKTKRPRAPRAPKPRKKREKTLPPAPPVPPRPASEPPIAPNARPVPSSSGTVIQAQPKTQPKAQPRTQPRTHTKAKASTQLPVQSPKPTRTSVPAPTPPPAPQPIPAPRLAGVVARLARQEASGVYVPDALRGTSPPPRARIVGEGRFLSHVSGTMRSAAFDIDKVLGIERLVARRGTNTVEYFVKWSGVPLREGSWESRDSLLKDVPGLVRDFDVRHPEKRQRHQAPEHRASKLEEKRKREAEQKEAKKVKDELDDSQEATPNQKLTRKGSVSGEIVTDLVNGKDGKDKRKSNEDPKKESEDAKSKPASKQYIDDVTGLPIPSWLDTPIVELNVAGMVLQIRRPNEAVLHNDATSAVRDAKKRQTRFKQENILLGERLFPLTKPEAKSVIDVAAKDHRQHNRVPISFPRGIGRVSPTDHGFPFAREDVLKAPPSWEAYFYHIGMVPTDYVRSLPPHMPTLDEAAQSKLTRARDELAFSTACEHRERARLLLRESFRHTGAPPPEHIFRDGIRAPPGEHVPVSKKRGLVGKSSEGNSRGLLRVREPAIETALKKARTLPRDKKGVWFDEIWACWRPEPS